MKYYKVMFNKRYVVAVFSIKGMAETFIKNNKYMRYTLKEFDGDIYTLDKLGE